MSDDDDQRTIEQRVAILEAQMRSVQMALPRGIGHVIDDPKERDRARARHAKRLQRAAGSCVGCGGVAYPGKTRCTPCGRKNTEVTKRRVSLTKGSAP